MWVHLKSKGKLPYKKPLTRGETYKKPLARGETYKKQKRSTQKRTTEKQKPR